MSAVGDLEKKLALVIEKITVALTNITVAQDVMDEGIAALQLALSGTEDPEALEALAAITPVSDDLISTYGFASKVRDAVTTYRQGLEVQEAVETSSTSIPHPSTHKAHRLVGAATDPKWARERFAELPKREHGGPTHGTFVDTDGTHTPLVSGSDRESHTASLTLLNSKRFPQIKNPSGSPAAADHVEAKAAQRMRDSGQTYGVLVINNTMCTGPLRCGKAVRAILPEGATLVVWEPNTDRPTTITGEAQP
ncbi:DddA-like double-stranded DNA deaminase toxin [Saccharopolyspora sp. 5N102]|uniref:DddA-like double-stranded DNA deaminase toxin n=1 Tax=Saccharopolyspora sp. 5N102 TaxID=3375155 RepID=UPI0037B46B9C